MFSKILPFQATLKFDYKYSSCMYVCMYSVFFLINTYSADLEPIFPVLNSSSSYKTRTSINWVLALKCENFQESELLLRKLEGHKTAVFLFV